ncbi:hypothetical protein AGMMS50230_07450 [Spirochaetia bacterium]|nr:hypothetical protein AGMMS50230_07450 [Spirochaetia bacterium]
MLLYDPTLAANYKDYGINIPIPADRGRQVLHSLEKKFYPGTRGTTLPYPGPVLDTREALAYLGISAGEPVITRTDLERVHSKEFIASLYGEGLEAALLNTFELIDAQGNPCRYEPDKAVRPLTDLFSILLAHVSGTYLACRLALTEGPGFCFYLGGGQHHARYDGPSGFCLVNDIVISSRKLLAEGRAAHIWIIDMDAHKGDGTAELIGLARKSGEACKIRTLSIHMARGWPLDEESLCLAKEGRAPLVPSDIDIGIEAGEEDEYCTRLMEGIRELEKLSEKDAHTAEGIGPSSRPDLILVVDGADPYEHDGLPSSGLLKLSLEQCIQRDMLVYRYAVDRNIPSAWVSSGGYGERAWEPPANFLRALR